MRGGGLTEAIILRLLGKNDPASELFLEETAHGRIGCDVEASLPIALSVLAQKLSMVNVGAGPISAAGQCSTHLRVESKQNLGNVALNGKHNLPFVVAQGRVLLLAGDPAL